MLLTAMCPDAHSTGAEVLTATVTNTGPAVMSKRAALFALAAASLMMVASTASAGAHEIVRYEAKVQPGTIVVKT
jgi:SOS-response transcriptional repressor LexA